MNSHLARELPARGSQTKSNGNFGVPAVHGGVQRAFHWSMAALVLVALGLGLWASFFVPGTPWRRGLLEIHKSLGFTVAILIAPRIAFRLFSSSPGDVEGAGWLARAAAGGAHFALYALMIIMPATGYLFSAAGGYSLPWFGLFQFPRLVAKNPGLAKLGQSWHGAGAWIAYAVISLHLAAVAWHYFYKRDDVLTRMAPSIRPRARPEPENA